MTPTQSSFLTGMDTYADVSVYNKLSGEQSFVVGKPEERQSSRERAAGGGGDSMSIETRMFLRLPEVRNVQEGKQLNQRDLMAGYSTSEEATQNEIKRARLERANFTKQLRAQIEA